MLSLGSIAHLQYYFARTGLLDGKGAQLAKDDRGKPGVGKPSINGVPRIRSLSGDGSSLEQGTEGFLEEETHSEEPVMLPPTVSTYSHRTTYVPPPPDSDSLRKELMVALKDAKKALQQVSASVSEQESKPKEPVCGDQFPTAENPHGMFSEAPTNSSEPSSWHEIQGLHILDVITLAIRAAKVYYTSHENPQRLYSIKTERQIREELLGTMDMLKRMAGRNFAGGLRHDELKVLTSWVNGIDTFLAKEQDLEKGEAEERSSWTWLEGSWEGHAREREFLFLSSFYTGEALPQWTPIDAENPKSNPFLETLRTGLPLIHLHNIFLKKSKRQYGEIKTFHTDLAKPYRCAENLRYWIKAAELRWEIKLKVNVSGVVNGKEDACPDFDAAILQWSSVIREVC